MLCHFLHVVPVLGVLGVVKLCHRLGNGPIAAAMWVQVSGGVSAQQLSFSSYPGELFSDDDFYITSSNMVVLETTNHIYNFTILQVRPGML
jgi:hypothetical protein